MFCKKKKKEEIKEVKKEEVKTETKEETKKTSKKGNNGVHNYHVVKREDGKWEVKYATGKKAIKLFDTQVEAVEYTKKLAANQETGMLVHKSKGPNKGKFKN